VSDPAESSFFRPAAGLVARMEGDAATVGVVEQAARPHAIEAAPTGGGLSAAKTGRWGATFVLASSSHPASVSLPVFRPRAV
jgi:hypothetical protein